MRLAGTAAIALFAAALASACTAIIGAHERTLERDGGLLPSRDSAAEDQDADVEGPPDAKPTGDADASDGGPVIFTVDVNGTWSSPNGAAWAKATGGVRITGMDASANNHPIIVPVPQPNTLGEDYTVRATVRAPASIAEFGLIVRMQADGSGVVFGNIYGGAAKSFLGTIPSSDWNPSLGVLGPAYSFVGGARYRLWLQVRGTSIAAKLWDETTTEPAQPQTLFAAPYDAGKNIAFYTYYVHDSVLESLTITVP